jgi:hypothetical protein
MERLSWYQLDLPKYPFLLFAVIHLTLIAGLPLLTSTFSSAIPGISTVDEVLHPFSSNN